jgi:hypothetical protein
MYEERLLAQATHQGYRQIGSRNLTDFELLARLQHHGAATRLVDATRSVLVALWFCVATRPETTGALIGIHSDHIGGNEAKANTDTYSALVEQLARINHPITFQPSAVSPRVAAQHSQFLLSRVAESGVSSLCLPTEEGATFVAAISPSLKAEAQDILTGAFDIRAVTLFPDLDGFAAANNYLADIGNMYRW